MNPVCTACRGAPRRARSPKSLGPFARTALRVGAVEEEDLYALRRESEVLGRSFEEALAQRLGHRLTRLLRRAVRRERATCARCGGLRGAAGEAPREFPCRCPAASRRRPRRWRRRLGRRRASWS
ncbi:MAG: hypothetical protein D6731_24030 [Planctomycetota bacterium]|nr:MAG: hypothetical protein D6731_24030 [Planctomycetota bacterium]